MTIQDVETKTTVSTEGLARVNGRKPVDMQRSAGRLLRSSAEKFYDAEIEKRQNDVAQAKGFDIAEHALSLYAHCTKAACPHRPPGKGR